MEIESACHECTLINRGEKDEIKLYDQIRRRYESRRQILGDELGLSLRFQSSDWTEFVTGTTTLALHQASDEHPAGSSQLGFGTDDIEKFYAEKKAAGIEFTSVPTETFGHKIARFRDSEGAECSVSGR